MPEMIMICDGHETCLEACLCKEPHDVHTVAGPGCIDPGSCYHNNHSDDEWHECGHIRWSSTVGVNNGKLSGGRLKQ